MVKQDPIRGNETEVSGNSLYYSCNSSINVKVFQNRKKFIKNKLFISKKAFMYIELYNSMYVSIYIYGHTHVYMYTVYMNVNQ